MYSGKKLYFFNIMIEKFKRSYLIIILLRGLIYAFNSIKYFKFPDMITKENLEKFIIF